MNDCPPPPIRRWPLGMTSRPEAFVEQISAHRWRAYVNWGATRIEGEYGTYAWSQKRAGRKAKKLLARADDMQARWLEPALPVVAPEGQAMSWFSKRAPEPESPAPIDGWTLTFEMSDGSVSKIDGRCYNEAATAEHLRVVDAMVDGLRAAGFHADATVTRKTVEKR